MSLSGNASNQHTSPHQAMYPGVMQRSNTYPNHYYYSNDKNKCTENRNCGAEEEEDNTEYVAMDIDGASEDNNCSNHNASASVSESDGNTNTINVKNPKRNKHRKHWILQSGYKLHGTLNKTKYRILKCIGKGRFSHVFSAYDECKRQNVAIKVDTNPKEKELLLFEYDIMRSFANLSPYICKVHDFGKLPKDIGIGNYLCMELCHEKNLSDKRKECPSKCFGIQKGALIGVEIMLSLKEFHEKGYVHRDIKPSNFVLPLSTYWKHHVYIVDFGLSKRFSYKTCKVQKEAEFIGTSLYASITAHNKLDLSPIDDLWSVAFVIIDISTNALPWKPLYVKLENQSKVRRNQVGKLKHSFIQQMLSNDPCTSSMPIIKEYKEFMRTLNQTKYNQIPKYDELIRILRQIASNQQYNEEQYVADHAPLMMDRPIHTNFEILNEDHQLQLNEISLQDSVLCPQFLVNHICSSHRPRGSWCKDGYHWTLNDEMHFRNNQQLPTVHLVAQNICNGAMQWMECDTEPCDQQHPKCGMRRIWNETSAFSKKKAFWGQEDVNDFMEFGLLPRGIPYDRRVIDGSNFKQHLNGYITPHYDALDSIFCDDDFAHDAVIDAWYKLNVSQSITVLKDLSTTHLTRDTAKRELLVNSMHRARTDYVCPTQHTTLRPNTLHAIRYPALSKKSNFNVDFNNANAQPILQRLEEFVRHARGKNIGNMNEIMDILMRIPPKYAIEVLDEIQNMGLQKISVVQSAIKRSCDQKQEWIERLQIKQNQTKAVAVVVPLPTTHVAPSVHLSNPLNTNGNRMHSIAHHNPKPKSIKSEPLENKTSIGNLGYLDHVISDTKQSPSFNPQQRNKFNYSRVRSYLTTPNTNRINRYDKNSFKMLIPKKKHLIGGNGNSNSNSHRSVPKNIAKKIHKKVNPKKNKKNKKKLKKKAKPKPKPEPQPKIEKAVKEEDEEDEDDIVNVKNRNHRKRKRAIDDSSDDEESTEMESSDSDDDIPIGRKRKKKRKRHEEAEPNKKKRKYNANDCRLSDLYVNTKRKRNTNISYREQDDDEQETQTQDMSKPFFAQIFGDENTSVAATQLTMRYDGMASQLDQMKQENMKRAKKEIARDIASHLVSKYKAQMDQNTIVPSGGVTCFKCNSDPNDMEWELLLCEYCSTGAAHCSCVDPMYCSVPEGAWACNSCQHEVITKHQDEYNRIVMAKHQELEKQSKRTCRSQSLRTKSFPSQPVFPGFLDIPSTAPGYPPPPRGSSVIFNEPVPPLPASMIFNAPAPAPAPQQQMFDQFLHALMINQKNATHPQAVAPSTNTININRLSVMDISCSNINGGILPIPPNQQSNNQCVSQPQPYAPLQTNDNRKVSKKSKRKAEKKKHKNKKKCIRDITDTEVNNTDTKHRATKPQHDNTNKIKKKKHRINMCNPVDSQIINNAYPSIPTPPTSTHGRNPKNTNAIDISRLQVKKRRQNKESHDADFCPAVYKRKTCKLCDHSNSNQQMEAPPAKKRKITSKIPLNHNHHPTRPVSSNSIQRNTRKELQTKRFSTISQHHAPKYCNPIKEKRVKLLFNKPRLARTSSPSRDSALTQTDTKSKEQLTSNITHVHGDMHIARCAECGEQSSGKASDDDRYFYCIKCWDLYEMIEGPKVETATTHSITGAQISFPNTDSPKSITHNKSHERTLKPSPGISQHPQPVASYAPINISPANTSPSPQPPHVLVPKTSHPKSVPHASQFLEPSQDQDVDGDTQASQPPPYCNNKDKTTWSTSECAEWVGSLGDAYKQYAKSFVYHSIDGELLDDLDDDLLKEIIDSGLHRRKKK
eukprot:653136_1